MAQGLIRFMAQAGDDSGSGSKNGGGGAGMSSQQGREGIAAAHSAQPGRMGDPHIGRIIGTNFRVLKLIGTGAMGYVYQAEQLSLGKMVALKLLRSELQGDERLLKRFELEARNASRLSHPNSIQIIDFGRDQDLLYIAMELLQGVDLGQLILREGPLPLARIGRIMDQVLGALDEAHAQRIVHRDLKPSNIMLASRRGDPDFVKVCDFGIAKAQTSREGVGLTLKGLVCGTPEYMSPEQARGDEVDGRSDLYAVGVILYQLVTGDLPFTASSPVGILSKHLNDPPVPPSLRRPGLSISTALESIILGALAKDPTRRPQTAEQLRRQLRAVLADLPDRPPHTGPHAPAVDREVSSAQPTTPVTIAQPRLARSAVAESASAPPLASTTSTMRMRRSGPLFWLALGLLGVGTGAWFILRPAGVTGPVSPERPPSVTAPVRPSVPRATEAPPPERSPSLPRGTGAASPEPALAPPPAGEPSRRRRPSTRPRRVRAAAAPQAAAAAPQAVAPLPPPSAEEPPAAPPARPPNLFQEAEQLLAQGQIASACEKAEDQKNMTPTASRVFRFLGRCYMRAGQPERAKQNFRRYLELDPAAPDAAFIKSIVK
jgi:serine/threonine protein kinase